MSRPASSKGLPEVNGVLAGPASGGSRGQAQAAIVNLNGLKFETDLVAGHKTGLYLDQQVNYQRVAELAKGAQVLDCFSFLGGFGLHAARAGAAHVHLLDQSAEAIAASTAQCRGQRIGGQMLLRGRQRLRLAQGADRRQAARKSRAALRLNRARPAVVHAQSRLRAGRLARLQGNPSARAQAAQTRRHTGDLLLLASRGRRHCFRTRFCPPLSTRAACCAAWPSTPSRRTIRSSR